MEEHCRLISDRDYKEWKECVQKMHILEKENKQLLKKLDELKKKLDIAVKALEWYAQPDESLAQEALKQIKEIK